MKINTLTRLMFLVTVIIGTTANAQWWGSGKKVKGNGEVITRTFDTEDYDGVSLSSSFDVELVEGSEGQIVVEAESNLMEYIEIEVRRGTLKIGTVDKVNISTRKGVLVKVPVEKISSISLAGSGDIYSTMMLRNSTMDISVAGSGDINLELECRDLQANVAGSGDIKLRGRAEQLDANVAGSGDIAAFDLKANNVNASIAGSGDVSVYCNGGKMKASIVGSGDLRYKGSASSTEKSVMGSGDITKM
jgi:hypothetical protein